MYSYIQRYALSQWSKYCGLTSRSRVSSQQYQCRREFFFSFFFLRAWPRSWHKEKASVVNNFPPIWLVHCPKLAFLIGYYNKNQLPQEFWIERSDRKVERSFTKIQLHLFSYCKYSSRIIIILRQNIHNGILQWCSHWRSHLETLKHRSLRKNAFRDTLTGVS